MLSPLHVPVPVPKAHQCGPMAFSREFVSCCGLCPAKAIVKIGQHIIFGQIMKFGGTEMETLFSALHLNVLVPRSKFGSMDFFLLKFQQYR